MEDSQTYYFLLEKYLSTIHDWNKENNCCDIEKLDFKIFELVAHSWVTVKSSFISMIGFMRPGQIKGKPYVLVHSNSSSTRCNWNYICRLQYEMQI
jgi:hypothetical protein